MSTLTYLKIARDTRLCHNPHDKGLLKKSFSVHCQEMYDDFEIVNHVFAHNFCTDSWEIFGVSQKCKG